MFDFAPREGKGGGRRAYLSGAWRRRSARRRRPGPRVAARPPLSSPTRREGRGPRDREWCVERTEKGIGKRRRDPNQTRTLGAGRPAPRRGSVLTSGWAGARKAAEHSFFFRIITPFYLNSIKILLLYFLFSLLLCFPHNLNFFTLFLT